MALHVDQNSVIFSGASRAYNLLRDSSTRMKNPMIYRGLNYTVFILLGKVSRMLENNQGNK